MKKTIVLLAVAALMFAMAAPALAADFIGGGGDDLWSNPANWNPAGVPTYADSGNLTMSANANVTTNANDIGGTLSIGGSDLIINADFGHAAGDANYDVTASGTITQNGGDVWFCDDMRTGGATHNMNGGTFLLRDYYRFESPSTINITGGSFTIGSLLKINGGSGTLKVVGDAATLISLGKITGFGSGTLDIVLKDGGITTIDVTGGADLPGTLKVTLDPSFVVPTSKTVYDLIVAGSVSGRFDNDSVNLPGRNWSLSTSDTAVQLTFDPNNLTPSVNIVDIFGDDIIEDRIVALLTDGIVSIPLTGVITDDGEPNDLSLVWYVNDAEGEPNDLSRVRYDDVPEGKATENIDLTWTYIGVYVVRLTASDGNATDEDMVTIAVYSDSCEAAKIETPYTSTAARLKGDTNYDCEVNVADLAAMAFNWLQ